MTTTAGSTDGVRRALERAPLASISHPECRDGSDRVETCAARRVPRHSRLTQLISSKCPPDDIRLSAQPPSSSRQRVTRHRRTRAQPYRLNTSPTRKVPSVSPSFDLLAAAISETRSADLTAWQHDSDIAERPEFYARRFSAESTDVELFLDLRRSPTLRTAFTAEYNESPALETFEAFIHQLIDVVLPRRERDHSNIDALAEAAVKEFLPRGTTATPAEEYPDDDCLLVTLKHPTAPDNWGFVFLGDQDDEALVRERLRFSVEFWWEALTEDGDINNAAGATTDSVLYGWLATELADSYRRLGAVSQA